MMMESKLQIYRSRELDLVDRIRWLKQDVSNLDFEFSTHGKDINPKHLDNIIGIANQIKHNLEVLK